MTKVPISVVIPAFNSEAFIAEAIESIHSQTFRVSEIIVVDDGSTDRTGDIAVKLGATVIRQPHAGISAARNAGIRAAQQEWIALLDADDLWAVEKIECQWSAIKNYPDVGLVTCDLIQWRHGVETERQEIDDICDRQRASCDVTYVARPEQEFLINKMNYNPPTMMIRRDLLLAVGMFDEEIPLAEGVECFLRVIAQCSIALVEKPLVKERLHDRNTSDNYVGMSLAWISIVDLIRSQPHKYPAGAADAMNRDVDRALIPLGRELLRRGRRHEARGLLRRSLNNRFSRRATMLWGLTFLRPETFNRLLNMKQRLKSVIGVGSKSSNDASIRAVTL